MRRGLCTLRVEWMSAVRQSVVFCLYRFHVCQFFHMSQEVEWVVTLNCLHGNEKIPLVEMLNIDLATVQFFTFFFHMA
jgi:hypothetical protein